MMYTNTGQVMYGDGEDGPGNLMHQMPVVGEHELHGTRAFPA